MNESTIIARVKQIERKIREGQPIITRNTTGENGYLGLNIEQFGRIQKINFVDTIPMYTSRGL